MIIFEHTYSDESLIDLEQHLMDVIYDEDLNLPQDEHGFRKGGFKVTVEWSDEE
jgi:hypothetical protein